MSLQTTTLLAILATLGVGCASSVPPGSERPPSAATAPTQAVARPDSVDPVLRSLGVTGRTLEIEGRLSSTGTQAMSGATFTALVDTNDDARLRMGGPFGITAARMVVTRESFTLVNYLTQEVWDGDPNAPALRTAMHLPVPAAEMMALLRGRVPGNPARFRRTEERSDGKILLTSRDQRRVEYLLVDPSKNSILQYQTKDLEGRLEVDVAFQDLRNVHGHTLPFKVILAAAERSQTATVEVDEITFDVAVDRPLHIDTPSSFSRKSFR